MDTTSTKGIWIAVLVVIIAIVAVTLGIKLFPKDSAPLDNTGTENNLDNETVYCTLDALLCSDGSYVGRVPPSCEFAACPAGSKPVNENSPAFDSKG